MGVSHLIGSCSTATNDIEPDLLLMNGRIATQDERRAFAQAVAVQDVRFAAVESNEQIMALRGTKSEIIDLGGRTVIPNLNDSHMHPIRRGTTIGSRGGSSEITRGSLDGGRGA